MASIRFAHDGRDIRPLATAAELRSDRVTVRPIQPKKNRTRRRCAAATAERHRARHIGGILARWRLGSAEGGPRPGWRTRPKNFGPISRGRLRLGWPPVAPA
eukprot:365396-Chlamydomonas_euryale.AAC.13